MQLNLIGSALEIMSGGTAGSSTVSFNSAGGLLKLDIAAAFVATIADLATSAQVLDLVDVAFASARARQ